MGRAFDSINDQMREFIERQHVFFVASAPSEGGHVNLSPKGLDSFRVLGPNKVAYLDLTGSGAETIAHVQQNGRISFMFCAFEGKPNIARVYGRGTVHLVGSPGFDELRPHFDDQAGIRSIITCDVDRTSNACGYAVPFMEFSEERTRLSEHWGGKDEDEIAAYWVEKNETSIDGIPAVPAT